MKLPDISAIQSDEALRQLGVAQTCGSIGFISSKYESYLEAHFRKNGRAWA